MFHLLHQNPDFPNFLFTPVHRIRNSDSNGVENDIGERGEGQRDYKDIEIANIPPKLIAMKGHPCTGKTTISRQLAELLCVGDSPVCYFDLDDVRDSVLDIQLSFPVLTAPATPASSLAKTIDDLSNEALSRMASTQLQMGFDVVLDCSLSRRSHLDRLLQLSNSTPASFVAVECKPEDEYEWKNRLNNRAADKPYKPSTWDDLQSELKETHEDFDDKDISKLVLNTTGYVYSFDVLFAVIGLSASQHPQHVDLYQWVTEGYKRLDSHEDVTPEDIKVEQDKQKERDMHFIGHVHHLSLSDEDKEGRAEISCNRCLESIPSGTLAYFCSDCKFVLHKPCAESPNEVKLEVPLPGNHQLPFLKTAANRYTFPVTSNCSAKNNFSDECWSCLYLTHVRCGFLPSVVEHHCHQHLLQFNIDRISSQFQYQCSACGDAGNHVSYSCFKCNIHVHVNCAFLPHERTHEYHRHPLKLSCPQEEEATDDFYCDLCETVRNAKNWIYYCAECDYASHLECALKMRAS